MEIYNLLELDKLDCSIAIIKNVMSRKLGKKDIIKIDSDYDVDLDVLGYVDPGVTIDIIKDGKLVVNTDVSKIAADGKTVEDLFREVFSYVG